jgi:ATP-dependent protease HslVU (ClpYQ) peptidase subunit
MSCVVAIVEEGHVYLGADTLGAVEESTTTTPRRDVKLFRSGPLVVGFSGSYRAGQVVQYGMSLQDAPLAEGALFPWLVTTFTKRVWEALYEYACIEEGATTMPSEFLIAAPGGALFEIYGDWGVAAPRNSFSAIGSGAPYALGLLKGVEGADVPPTERVIAALEVAEHFDAAVGQPWTLLDTRAVDARDLHAARIRTGSDTSRPATKKTARKRSVPKPPAVRPRSAPPGRPRL